MSIAAVAVREVLTSSCKTSRWRHSKQCMLPIARLLRMSWLPFARELDRSGARLLPHHIDERCMKIGGSATEFEGILQMQPMTLLVTILSPSLDYGRVAAMPVHCFLHPRLQPSQAHQPKNALLRVEIGTSARASPIGYQMRLATCHWFKDAMRQKTNLQDSRQAETGSPYAGSLPIPHHQVGCRV